MKIHIFFCCVICLVSFVVEFGKSKDIDKVKVDGGWSTWGSWSSCSQETPPYRYKERNCTDPAPQNGGSTCSGVNRRRGTCEGCQPLGFENGKIKDEQISSPNSHDKFPARHARLNGNSSWCGEIQGDEIYLETDLRRVTTISAIGTQGFYPDPAQLSLRRGRVSKYELTYSQDGLRWELYVSSSGGSDFSGNLDKHGTVMNVLSPEIYARFVRIYPLSFFSFICMRVELYGCYSNCGGRLTESPGNLMAESSDTEDEDCLWLVDLPSARKIHFHFVNFAVPCKSGVVEIRDGSLPYGAASVLGHYCGFDETPPAVIGKKGKLWVRFKSNASDPLVGFHANYFPGCGGHLTADDGALISPNFPKNYFHNSRCSWTITAPEGKVIHLKFQTFDVDGDSDRHRCPTDSIAVWDGVNTGVPLIGRFCNSNLPPPLLCSSNNTLRLKFRADDVIARTGFLATFHAVDAGTVCSVSSSLPLMPLTPSLSSLSSSLGTIMPSTSTPLLITTIAADSSTLLSADVFSTISATAYIQANDTKSTRAYLQTRFPERSKALNSTQLVSASRNVSGNDSEIENPNISARENGEDDDKDDLTTLLIISAFGFIVLCLIAASIIPGIKHHCEKRKKEKESNSMEAELGTSDNINNLSEHGNIFPVNCGEDEESSLFLPLKADSVSLSQESAEDLPPEYEAESTMNVDPVQSSKKTGSQEEDVSVPSGAGDYVLLHSNETAPEAQLKDVPEEGDFHMSYEDLGTSFALEMQAMMSKFEGDTEADLEPTDEWNASTPENSEDSPQESVCQGEGTAGPKDHLSPNPKEPDYPGDADISSISTENGSQDDHDANCAVEGNPQLSNKLPESNNEQPELSGNRNSTPRAEGQPPSHMQPDVRSLNRMRGMKTKGKLSAGSYAESKDSGCASSLECVYDTETCV